MDTMKLYERDSYLTEFTATVLSCQPARQGFEVVLDKTAFYPEGGGQPWDVGVLGGAAVLEVHDANGQVVHTCDRALKPGSQVAGVIDWDRRFDLMQQHSGEHILSGLICSHYGCDNVGFHLGGDVVTIDFNHLIPNEDLEGLELAANRVIWANQATQVFYPTPEDLAQLPYRSKKALSGQVRIVRFPGADICACCGTHVSRAGEIGLLKILSCVKFREGVRMEILAGARALRYVNQIMDQNRQVSQQLSAKVFETAAAVKRLSQEAEKLQYRLTGLENAEFAQVAEDLRDRGDVLVFRQDLDADGVRKLALAVQDTCGGRCAIFSGSDEDGYKYVLAEPGGDIRELGQMLNQMLHGRGGGKPGFVQGTVQATRSEIHGFFQLFA